MDKKPVRNTRKRKSLGDDDANEDASPKKKIAKTKAEKNPENKIKKIPAKPKAVARTKTCDKPAKETLKKKLNTESFGNTCLWDEAEMLSLRERIPLKLAQNFIALLTEGCTLPFIARYRKTVVDHLMPDR